MNEDNKIINLLLSLDDVLLGYIQEIRLELIKREHAAGVSRLATIRWMLTRAYEQFSKNKDQHDKQP